MKGKQVKTDLAESNIKILAIVLHKLSKEEEILIHTLVTAIFNIEPYVYNLSKSVQSLPSIKEEDIILFFGIVAKSIFKLDFSEINFKNEILLPEPEKLLAKEENEEERNRAWRLLQEFLLDKSEKENYCKFLNKSSLPTIETNNILELEKQYPNGWVGKTEDGKTIRLSSNIDNIGNEDIHMTFKELYTLKLAVELLNIKEFELVPKTNSNRNSPYYLNREPKIA